MALEVAVGDEVVDVGVVLQAPCRRPGPACSSRGAGRTERPPSCAAASAGRCPELHLEARLPSGVDCVTARSRSASTSASVALGDSHCRTAARGSVQRSRTRRSSRAARPKPFVDEHQVELEFEEVVAASVQVRRAPLDGLVDDRLTARRRHDRRHPTLRQVVIEATGLVQTAQRRLVAMDDVTALRVVETLEIDARQAIDDPQVAGFREERVVVHESP